MEDIFEASEGGRKGRAGGGGPAAGQAVQAGALERLGDEIVLKLLHLGAQVDPFLGQLEPGGGRRRRIGGGCRRDLAGCRRGLGGGLRFARGDLG